MLRWKWWRLLAIILVMALSCVGASADGPAPVDPMSEGVPEETAQDAQGDVVIGNPMFGVGGEEVIMTDAETQDWYDEMYARAVNYQVPRGTVVDGALRVPGQETLEEIEIASMLALEGYDNVSDLISTEGRMNIFLLGIDARPGQNNGRSDTMILVSVELATGRIKLVSFMRDLYVYVDGLGPNRLNAAYVTGGYERLTRTMANNFGVSADHYVAVDFSVLGSLIDQLGGLEINVEDQYFVDRINAVIEQDNKVLGLNKGDGRLAGPGLQVLTGKQAQAYARFRYGARSGGDFGRTGRQREVIMKIFEKIQQLSVFDLIRLATDNIDKVKTDLTLADLIRLVPVVLKLNDATFEELRIPQDGMFTNQTIYKMAVLVPDMNRINASLREFLGN